MDDFIHRVRNGSLKPYGNDRNRNNDRRKSRNSGPRKSRAADNLTIIKKPLEKICDSYKRLAEAEERKAVAMERIADCLGPFLKTQAEKVEPDGHKN